VHAPVTNTTLDKVRDLQDKLYALGGQVMTPVLVPVAVGAHSPELQHCLGSVETTEHR